MADPQRLIDGPDLSPLGRAALESSADDGPSSTSRRDVARKLGIAAGLATVVSGEAVATGTALWWKLAMVVVIAGGVTVGVITHSGGSDDDQAIVTPPPPAQIAAPGPSGPARVEVAPPPAPAPVAEAPTAPMPPEAPPPPHVRAPARVRVAPPVAPPAQAPAPAPAAAPEPAPAPSDISIPPVEVTAPEVAPPPPAPVDPRRLALEVSLIDRARAAVTANDIPRALAVLDEYRKSFADGALVEEAELVRIEALLAAHRSAEASEAGRAFLARFPHSPLARRVRSMLSSANK